MSARSNTTAAVPVTEAKLPSQQRRTVILIIALIAALPISGMGTEANRKGTMTGSVPVGVWGGDHIIMNVASDGAEIEFDCARGQILEPLVVDEGGHFRLKGIYKAETPAPMQDADGSEANAVYSGTLQGNKLLLEVSISGVEGVQSFELVYGQRGQLTKCA